MVGIYISEVKTGPMQPVVTATALPGRGLQGDRYAAKAGTFTPRSDRLRGYDLTLIESEVLERVTFPDGSHLTAPEARRNLVTRGIDLNALVGREFTIGSVRALGQRLCEPCVHLQRLTRPGVIAGLVHQGGLRADILTDGEIRLGDTIAGGDCGQQLTPYVEAGAHASGEGPAASSGRLVRATVEVTLSCSLTVERG